MFRDRWCIIPKQQPFAVAASQGSLTHRLIEKGPDGIEMVRAQVQEYIQHLLSRIDAGEDLLGYIAQEANELDNQFNKALAMATVLWEKYPRPKHHKILAKEKTIDISFRLGKPEDMPFPIVNLRGRLDEIVLDEKSSLIYIRDYKTTSRDVTYTLTGYHYSLQCRLYRLLAGAFLQDLPDHKNRSPDGFILEILQVPTISMGSKDRDYTEYEYTFTRGSRKGETEMRRDYEGEPQFSNYLQRCRGWYAERGDEAVQSFAVRFIEPVLPQELSLALGLAVIYQNLPADVPSAFPRDTTASYCKFMNRICPYYDLCCTDEAAWPAIIESKYEVKPPIQLEATDCDPKIPKEKESEDDKR